MNEKELEKEFNSKFNSHYGARFIGKFASEEIFDWFKSKLTEAYQEGVDSFNKGNRTLSQVIKYTRRELLEELLKELPLDPEIKTLGYFKDKTHEISENVGRSDMLVKCRQIIERKMKEME